MSREPPPHEPPEDDGAVANVALPTQGGQTLEVTLDSEQATLTLGQRIASSVEVGDLIILEGGLGAGKTFLAGAIVHALGYEPDLAVTSPTYTLVNEYAVRLSVAHADLYRLRGEDEVHELGLEEKRAQGFLLLIEWGTPYLDLLGGDGVIIQLTTEPRRARLVGSGPRARELLTRIRSKFEAPSAGPHAHSR